MNIFFLFEGKKEKKPFSGDKIPSSITSLGFLLFGTFCLTLVLTFIICVAGFVLNGYNWETVIELIKYCVSLSFWLYLCCIPIIGLYFVISFPSNAILVAQLFDIHPTFGIWVVFVLFFFFSFSLYLLSTLIDIILLHEDYEDEDLREKNKKQAILIFIASMPIGIMLIFLSNPLFSLLSNFLLEL